MARVGVGYGKLILFGEHAAVYGYRAVGIPLDVATRAEVATAGGEARDPPEPVVRRVLERLGIPLAGASVTVESSVPRGVGFGSSASLCVACAAALLDAGMPYGERVWQLAHGAECLFHGTPSGIDTGLSLLPGIRAFRPNPPALPEQERLPDVSLDLVVGATPRSSSTAELVAGLRARMGGAPDGTRAAVASLGDIAEEAVAVLGSPADPARTLGELADRAQAVLAGLGLSSPETDALLARGKKLGALGGKLSGAGGGGAYFLVAPDPPSARRIAAELCLLAAPAADPRTVRAVLFRDGKAQEAPHQKEALCQAKRR